MVRKIVSDISVDVLDEDLKRYRDMALELGAVDAKVIPADAVVTDVRVRAKCAYPRYGNYDGRNANCPPYAMDLDQVRRTVEKHKHRIFFKLEVPSELIVSVGAPFAEQTRHLKSTRKVFEIVSKLRKRSLL